MVENDGGERSGWGVRFYDTWSLPPDFEREFGAFCGNEGLGLGKSRTMTHLFMSL